MKLQSDDISRWAISLEDFKPEYTAIKCWSLLQFFQLTGRRTVLNKENLAPIIDLHYCVYSEAEQRIIIGGRWGKLFCFRFERVALAVKTLTYPMFLCLYEEPIR